MKLNNNSFIKKIQKQWSKDVEAKIDKYMKK